MNQNQAKRNPCCPGVVADGQLVWVAWEQASVWVEAGVVVAGSECVEAEPEIVVFGLMRL